MEELVQIIQEMQIPFAYDHFAEGESPDPPFICYLIPGSNNFAADGRVYFKLNEVRIEMYTDFKDIALESRVEDCTSQHILDTNFKKLFSYIVRLHKPYDTLDIAPRNAGQLSPTI